MQPGLAWHTADYRRLWVLGVRLALHAAYTVIWKAIEDLTSCLILREAKGLLSNTEIFMMAALKVPM